MAAPIIVRVRGYQQDEEGRGSVHEVTAESTAPRLQDTTSHTVVRPKAERCTPAQHDGYVWLDLISTTDPALTPTGRRWKLTLWHRRRELRCYWIEVPHEQAQLVRYGPDGREDPTGDIQLPSLWLTDVEDFADELGGPPIGSLANYYTRAHVDQLLDDLVISGGGARDLDDLRDVDLSTAGPGDALVQDVAGWTARPLVHQHTQPGAAKAWLILHRLPHTPAGVQVTGQDGRRLYPQRVTFPQPGQCRIDFPVAVAGSAVLY